jgi:hypothetical protein
VSGARDKVLRAVALILNTVSGGGAAAAGARQPPGARHGARQAQAG